MLNIFLVGGSVRDKLLGLSVREFDWVVVNSSVNYIIKLGFKKVGKDFPVFLHPLNKEEYTLARKERKVGKGYYGFKCDFSSYVSLKEDLLRRDLTFNTFVLNEFGFLIDLFDGKLYLFKKQFLHVSYAFFEDPLRILRIFRFYVKYFENEFKISHYTISFIRKIVIAGEIFELTLERILKEIFSSLNYKNSFLFFFLLYKYKVLKIIFYDLHLLFEFSEKYSFNFTFNFILQTNLLFLNIYIYTNNIFLKFSLLFLKLSFNNSISHNFYYLYHHSKKSFLLVNRYVKDFNLSKKYKFFLLNLFKFKWFFINSFLIGNYFLFLFFCKTNSFKDKIKLINLILINDLDSKLNDKIYVFYNKYLFLDLVHIMANYKYLNTDAFKSSYIFYKKYFKNYFCNTKFYYNKYY